MLQVTFEDEIAADQISTTIMVDQEVQALCRLSLSRCKFCSVALQNLTGPIKWN